MVVFVSACTVVCQVRYLGIGEGTIKDGNLVEGAIEVGGIAPDLEGFGGGGECAGGAGGGGGGGVYGAVDEDTQRAPIVPCGDMFPLV